MTYPIVSIRSHFPSEDLLHAYNKIEVKLYAKTELNITWLTTHDMTKNISWPDISTSYYAT